MKKLFALFLTMILCLSLTACGNTVDTLISEIAALENKEITLADEERIDRLYNQYTALPEEEKAKITNFPILEEAATKVNHLSYQMQQMEAAPRVTEAYIKSYLKIPSTMQIIKTNVYASKDNLSEVFVRMQYTCENALGGKVEETCFVLIRDAHLASHRIVTSAFGNAQASWNDVDLSIGLENITDQIDFDNQYVPAK